MPTRITAAELAANLPDILDRVRNGEEFVVEDEGEAIARLTPPAPPQSITAQDLIRRLGNLSMPGEGFADDLEAIQAEQPKASVPPWDTHGAVE